MKTENRLLLGITTVIVAVVAVISIFGMILYNDTPELLQGEIECTQIKISGKLLGRIEKFYVKEGDTVKAGDTLVLINSPETNALMQSASAMKDAAYYQQKKVDAGAREQIIESLKQAWLAAQSQATLASNTYARIERLYQDSVVTLQRKEEVQALAQTAIAAEQAAHYQYLMAVEGAQQEDKLSAQALTMAAQGNVEEIQALLKDTWLLAPKNGIVGEIYPAEGELVIPASAIMDLLAVEDNHLVLNVREDLLNSFLPGNRFIGKIPALDNTKMEFEVYYTSPLGSFATWQSSRQSGSYDLKTFKIKAKPVGQDKPTKELRPGMSVIVNHKEKKQ